MEKELFDNLLMPLKEIGVDLCSVTFGEEDGEKTLFVKIDSKNGVGEKTLFVKIDSKDGVDTDLCVKATEIINPIVDKLDLIKEEYVLDVCSKGEE